VVKRAGLSPAAVLEHLRHLRQDFELEMAPERADSVTARATGWPELGHSSAQVST
jgi:hypothetical protein